jgi:urease accessory protein
MATSPFPATSSQPGLGKVTTALQPGTSHTVLSECSYTYPLKLISPSASSPHSALLFLLSYGGGLISGDHIALTIHLVPSTRLSIVTQGHTKVYPVTSPEIVTSQELDVVIGKDAALCLLPDPVQPWKGSRYRQKQVFRMAEGASLALLDWVSAGRTARGEEWEFVEWKGRNEIRLGGSGEGGDGKGTTDRLLLRDNLILNGDIGKGGLPLGRAAHGASIFGTLILRGPLVASLSAFFLDEFGKMPRIGARDFRSPAEIAAAYDNTSFSTQGASEAAPTESLETWRLRRQAQEKADGVLWSAATVRGCTVVKFCSRTVEGARHWVGEMVLREESIIDEFGEDAVMCIRP